MNQSKGSVYIANLGGHRREWLDLLSQLLGLKPVNGRITMTLFRELIHAQKLLFATLDDDIVTFVAVAVVRSLLRRPTAALFLQPQRCFLHTSPKSMVKRWIFQTLRTLPGLVVVTILPFDLAPQLASVAHGGVVDPQYWDLHDLKLNIFQMETELSRSIKDAAKDRKVLCLLGGLTTYKGFQFITETLKAKPDLMDHYIVVAAGRVAADSCDIARDFVQYGGVLIDRWLDDSEVMSLYSVSKVIWSCYTPEYDQASGIFGRAIQLGLPVIVRRGSFIDNFAHNITSHVISVEFGSIPDLAKALIELELPSNNTESESTARMQQTAAWREHFIVTLEDALNGTAPNFVVTSSY